MSCSTLSQSLVGFNVTMASLPEGFCPVNIQDLANTIAARLVVASNQATSSFAIGSVPPTSNVGPWFKDCEEWFKFDDATATYVPLEKQGFDNMQYFAASGTFTVPPFISKIKITAFGGGGGSMNKIGIDASSGGGGGAFGVAIRTVLPNQAIAIVVGSGGANGAPGTAGGATTILGMSSGGGGGGSTVRLPGVGGVATGFDINFTGQTGGSTGATEVTGGMGGDAGGWGGKGGSSGNDGSGLSNGIAPGGGGGGGSSASVAAPGGSGAAGGVLIEF